MNRLGSNAGCSMPAPTRARVPPRRSWWNPASMAAFLPEHSSTTWTARVGDPLGLPRRESLEVGRVEHLGGPEARAASCLRRSPGSTAVTGPMPRATRAAMESAPIGPAPMTITLSPGARPSG